uniref:Acetyl-CoA acetyltransferase n=1 Tax=Pseudomonas phage Ulina01 TaxID=3138549 RepID=A0AAU6W051_9CAUD
MATSVTGDLKDHKDRNKQGVTLHNMPVYPKEVLADAKSSLNIRPESGKRFGALVTASGYSTPVLYQAAGDAPTSPWIAVTKAGTDIIPA